MSATDRLLRRLTPLAIGLAMVGCGSGQYDDLRQFVNEPGDTSGARARVDPLPRVEPYQAATFVAAEIEDPFRPRKVEPARAATGNLQPDLNRRREPLEAFPLDNLRMVGTLQQGKQMFALIRTPDNNLFRVRVNNYMGQNFGLIQEISESGVKLKELVQDGNGEWTERVSSLMLQDETETKR